tara:strand:+ start:6575 stop:6976 length:402 start_codon:yes stop_codon:yes gene_type:complete
MKIKRAVTVTFPAPLPAEIKCPICEGNRCKVCDMTGKIKVTVDAKIPIQRSHIVKYIVDNIRPVSSEITRQYGMTPQIETLEVIDIDGRNYEIVQISSIGGACWIANRLDELESPRYFHTYQEIKKFKGGMSE